VTLRRTGTGSRHCAARGAFAGPKQVLTYLARYTRRIAISNERLVGVEDDQVRFRYKDYAAGSVIKEMRVDAPEFLRRFLLHVVPRGFMRIRYYGITANRHREQKLARARELLGQPPPSLEPLAEEKPAGGSLEPNTTDTAADQATCPACGGRICVVEIIAPNSPGAVLPFLRPTRHVMKPHRPVSRDDAPRFTVFVDCSQR
jgi:Putative transposase